MCKCAACRHSCCEGWAISISLKEYYRLLGSSCSEALRSKIDRALKVYEQPSKERYAQISIDWNGRCMLHCEDGLCALQLELGEKQLPEICRLYPHTSKQLADSNECSCSNSCEKVIELLMDMKEPLKFHEKELSFLPYFNIKISLPQYEGCKKSISILQDRSLSLSERFLSLGNSFGITINKSVLPDYFYFSFQLLTTLNTYYENNISIGDYCNSSRDYFSFNMADPTNAKLYNTKKYKSAAEHLELIQPDWQIHMEQLIVNHMFYTGFPYYAIIDNESEAFLSLIVMYAFLRLNVLGYMSDKTMLVDLVNCEAAMFRLIEHSNFDIVAMNLFSKETGFLQANIAELINL